MRTPCGWLRLGVTLAHNKKAFLSFKMIYPRLVKNTKFKKVYLRKSLNKARRLLVSLTNAFFLKTLHPIYPIPPFLITLL